MKFPLSFTDSAKDFLKELKNDVGLKRYYKAVTKALKFLSENPKHPSLQTHHYHSLKGPGGEKVFEVYAQQKTPAAYRIFFFYGPAKREITIFSITPHP